MPDTNKQLNVLNISLDPTVLDPGSDAGKRMSEFGSVVTRYAIVVPARASEHRQIGPNVDAYSAKAKWRPVKFVKLFFRAGKLLKESNFHVITAQDPFETGLIAWILSKRHGAGLHLQEHGDFFSRPYWRRESALNFLRYFLGKFLLQKADSIRVVSSRIKKYLADELGINRDRITKVPVFSRLPELSKELAKPLREEYPDKFIFLTMARLVNQKNLGLAIQAFEEVVKEYPQSILVIVGRGPERKSLEKRALWGRAGKKIIFKEWTDDIYAYYASADAYVLSSNYEGWARVVIEAAHMDLPVVMTDVGCAGEVVKDSESGLVVPPQDKDALSEAMKKLVEHEWTRQRLAKNAKEAISRLPGKQKTLRLYQESWFKAVNSH